MANNESPMMSTSKVPIKIGSPTISEMKEGMPQIRAVPGKGLFQFVRVGDMVYHIRLRRGLP